MSETDKPEVSSVDLTADAGQITDASGGQVTRFEEDKLIAKMISRRAGKKRSIYDIISERGSTTKISILLKELKRVYSEAEELHAHVLELLDPDDPRYSDIWIEDL